MTSSEAHDRTAASDAAPGDAAPATNEPSDDIDLQVQVAEANDRALRARAELDNYRKRVQREIEDERRFAAQPLLVELLSVIDNVQRAIAAAEKSPEGAGLLEGFKMVARQLDDVLARHGCKRIEALNKPFDPHLHQAIAQQPSADVPPGTVLLVAQDGYQLHDRVIRPSHAIVSKAPE
ncbi:MAG: nucleotide exchange factor GrpE [Pirellulales bacterium]|nr:nucleotide exchange factor GrpE [Pirellulales bacterium]